MKKFLAALAIALGLAAFGAGVSHADTTRLDDACLDGWTTTKIIGMDCEPGMPTASQVCATGHAHLTLQAGDYCPHPSVVVVGESELGTLYVPRLFAPTRLNVAMRRTSLRSMQSRCARLGGHSLRRAHGLYICHNVKH